MGTKEIVQQGRGILTVAIGKDVYIEHAKNLARSFRFHNPDLPIAVITDSSDPRLFKLYDHLIPLETQWGGPFRQKLSVAEYSPFEETLFIDSDCLVTKDVSGLWSLLSGRDFAMPGEPIQSGHWYTDIAPLLARLGLTNLPKFNSGLFLFRRGDAVKTLMASARDILDHHREYGIEVTHNGHCGDEPALAIAMAMLGVDPVEDTGVGQWGSFDYVNPRLELDVLAGKCRYIYDHRVVEPTVAHFLAHGWRGKIYRRETIKLRLLLDYGFPRSLASIVGDQIGRFLAMRSALGQLKRKLWPLNGVAVCR